MSLTLLILFAILTIAPCLALWVTDERDRRAAAPS
jgi:hypothetical protein